MMNLAGAPVKLGDSLHDITVLAFWAPWCHPCLEELPQLDRVAAENHDPRVAFVAINIEDARAETQKLFTDNHYTLPVLLDPDAAAYRMLFPEQGEEMISIPALAIVKHDQVAFRSDGLAAEPGAFARELHEQIAAALR
jgi:thiol-disulfide isomerase/thioredoxin